MKTVLQQARTVLVVAFAGLSLFFLFVYISHRFLVTYRQLNQAIGIAVICGLAVTVLFQYKKWSTHWLIYLFTRIIQFFLAYMFVFYATGKLFNLQFYLPPGILDQKASELDGFWKAWIFFAHSYTYGVIIAITQILVALLLFFRRTTTGALLVYLVLMANIVVVDFSFGVEAMQLVSVILLVFCIFLLWPDLCRMLRFFTGRATSETLQPVLPEPAETRFTIIAVLLLLATAVQNVLFFYANAKKMNLL